VALFTSRRSAALSLGGLAAASAALLFLPGPVRGDGEGKEVIIGRGTGHEQVLVPVKKELGTERYLAHLATDKPVYHPGETVYGRAAILDAFTRVPASRGFGYSWEVRSARGEAVATGWGNASSVAPFAWSVPQGLAGGSYKLVLQFAQNEFAPAEASFDVREYRVPRLDMDLQFARKAYGAGETVSATLKASRAEGGVPKGTAIAVATVDGVEVHRSEVGLDAIGGRTISFSLPEKIGDGSGTLTLVVKDGGVEETIARSIPIVVSRVKLDVYPEGGDLVGDLEGRVYFEARTPAGKPADVSGRVIDATGETLARFKSEHEGRGRFSFTPRTGGRYALVIEEPKGISEPISLPEAVAAGGTLSSLEESGNAGDPLRLRVASTIKGKVKVVLACREREVVKKELELQARAPEDVTLEVPGTAEGVLRATLLDEKDRPLAERLVFRRPAHGLKVQVETSSARGALRDRVKVVVKTTDLTGKPVPAMVTLSAVDDAVLSTIEPRERAARLPTQALLGSEVKELADATAYFGEGGSAKLDLLLGTQGWRRFAFVDAAAFLAKNPDSGARVLALQTPPPPAPPAAGHGGGFWRGMALGGAPAPEAAPAAAAPPPRAALARVKREEAGRRLEKDRRGDEPRAPMKKKKPPQMKPQAADDKARPFDPGRDELDEEIPVVAVREFAHAARAPLSEGRTDFAETLYWNAGIETNAAGEAVVNFELADSVTTYRLRADAFGRDGALGAGDGTIEARRPFYCEPKLPIEVTAGDRIDMPLALVNGTLGGLRLSFDLGLTGALKGRELPSALLLGPEERSRVLVGLDVQDGSGDASVRVRAHGGDFDDDVTRKVRVVPAGFPIEVSLGGRLDGETVHTIRIPEKLSPGSLVTEGLVYPSPLASIGQAVESLLREPCGCFEQTSSSNYPNVMALQYLKTHAGVDPAIVARAQALLDSGYRQLVHFECREKGYEWFGQGPGHEALSAYGVLEFTDMAAVYPVDDAMLARTRAWLLARRDGKGGFTRNPKSCDSFGAAPQDVTDVYITWALSQAGVPGIEKEVATVREHALASNDPYILALAANILLDTNDAAAEKVLAKLVKAQDRDGSWKGAQTSITRSGGESLEIETTSFAILALLRSPSHVGACEDAMRWLLERAKGGRFGATQSTILALKAIVAYDAAHATPKKAGSVLLEVDGKVYDEVSFAADRQGPIVLPSFADALSPGEHKLKLRLVGGAAMPYSISVRCHSLVPASSPACKVALETALSSSQVKEGETVDLRVTFANRTAEGQPMAVAIVGLPGGLEARADQLKELVAQGKIDFYEVRGRDLVLYRSAMAPSQRRSFTLSLVAAVPGVYTGPASRAYLYYTDEDKVWLDPLKVTITH
jgi:hypothetical protein